MKNIILISLIPFAVFAQDIAKEPEAINTQSILLIAFLALKTPVLGLIQQILKGLPQNGVVKFLSKVVDLLAANVAHK